MQLVRSLPYFGKTLPWAKFLSTTAPTFVLINKWHLLQARNLEQKREWTLQLKRVILENYNAVIPLHARQLVMELGQSRTEGMLLLVYG